MTHHRLLSTLLAIALLVPACAFGQELSELTWPPSGDNERAEVSQWIGLVKVTIAYHSPNVHGGGGADRTGHIWGELVHYGFFDDGYGPSHTTPWRAGANETTTISFSHDVKINGQEVKAGTYGLFLAIEKSGPWTWVLSKNASGWGGYQYDPKEDVLRLPADPQDAPYTEFLTYGFDERRPNSTVAFLQWEKKRISFKIDVPNINELYVAQIRRDLQSWPGFNYQNWQNAAQFCAVNKINLEEALVWADKAINEPFRGVLKGGRKDFYTLSTKANVLRAMGKQADADRVMEEAVHLPGNEVLPVFRYAYALLKSGKKEKALDIFKENREKHPEEKFWTYFGLAKAYTAVGDKPHAIENWKAALLNVPDFLKPEVPDYENTLKQLSSSN